MSRICGFGGPGRARTAVWWWPWAPPHAPSARQQAIAAGRQLAPARPRGIRRLPSRDDEPQLTAPHLAEHERARAEARVARLVDRQRADRGRQAVQPMEVANDDRSVIRLAAGFLQDVHDRGHG